MKRLLIILLLFSSVTHGQYIRKIITSGTGYDQANNILMAFGIHIPPANAYGHKHPVFIYLHGIDHRGARGDTIGADGIDLVAQKGIPKLIASTPLPYFQKPGGYDNDLYRWAVVFPQCSSEYGVWPPAYTIEAIKLIKSTYSSVIDTNMIVLVGYSLGGGGVMTQSKDSTINTNISMLVNISGGYSSSPNYTFVCNSGIPFYHFASAVDPTAPVSLTDNFVNQLLVRNPVTPAIQYIRFSDLPGTPTNDHDQILNVLMDTIPGDSYTLSNGNTWVNSETIFSIALKYKKQRRKR